MHSRFLRGGCTCTVSSGCYGEGCPDPLVGTIVVSVVFGVIILSIPVILCIIVCREYTRSRRRADDSPSEPSESKNTSPEEYFRQQKDEILMIDEEARPPHD